MAEKIIRITVVGDGDTGKTCMLIVYKDKRFDDRYIPTVWVFVFAISWELIYIRCNEYILGPMLIFHTWKYLNKISIVNIIDVT